MRNPRRIVLTDEILVKHNLSTAPPPPDSLFWVMWRSCEPIARQALETPFIQGIAAGTLDPVCYGGFNVSDAYYCFSGAHDYSVAAERAKDPTVEAFLTLKHESYRKYNATFPGTWHVRDAAGIVPIDVCRQYSEYETGVASREDPIYSLVVMLPCEYLWYWLATQLQPVKPQNLYAPWVTGNDDSRGPYAIGNFLDSFQKAHPDVLDPQKAIEIYTRATSYEHLNFAAALPAGT